MNRKIKSRRSALLNHVAVCNAVIFGFAPLALPSVAVAQEEPREAEAEAQAGEDTIVVIGSARVIQSGAEIKRNADAIVDSITQFTISRLPDVSIAETLDRVAGVSSDIGFNSSQPRTVTVRGFDSRYNSTSIDGNPIWNSSRNNRGTQLDVFPSSVVSSVNVYKTVTPGLDANSVGGHIELRTLRAFDGGDQPYFTSQASYGFYEQSDTPRDGAATYRADVAGKFTFGRDNQFGVVLGADFQSHQFTDLFNDVRGSSTDAQGVRTLAGNLAFNGQNQTEIRRQAYYGKLETRRDSSLYAFAALSYFTEDNTSSFNRSGFFFNPGSVTNATATTGDFTGAAGIVFVEPYIINRSTVLVATGLDYQIGAASLLTVRAGYVNYDNDETLSRSTQFRAFENFEGSYDISGNQPRFQLTPSSQALFNDPSLFLGRPGATRSFDFVIPHQDNVYSLRAQFDYNSHADASGLGFSAGLSFRRLDRLFDQTTELFGFNAPNLPLSEVLVPGTPFTGAPGGENLYFIDYRAFTDFSDRVGVRTVSDDLTADYDLSEDVWAGHAAVYYNAGALRILAGARIEHTSYTNQTANMVAGAVTPVTNEHEYTNILPNVQAIYDVNERLRLRGAYTQTIARPDFADFAFGRSVSFSPSANPALPDVEVVSGTNPFLDARVSSNFDASLEYYLDGGLFSVGVFVKNFDREIFTQRIETRNDAGDVVRIDQFPLNNSEASVRGFEVTYEQNQIPYLPPLFEGLGFAGNFTYLDGQWDVVFNDGTVRSIDGLRNQPDWLASMNLFYNRGPVWVSLAYRMRGQTFTGSFGPADQPERDIYVDNYNRLDLQAAYNLTDRLQVYAAARNLTDTFYVERFGADDGLLRRSINPGRLFWLGLKYAY
ncbi:TonB-dependent receptor [Hyphomonadaceae bacterium BL14]|nr:TonB-dependent receptor [Hyphomonadaceae bacterium BL14]